MGVKRYCDLLAWQRAMTMVEAVYQATQTVPKDERYGLTSQIRKAAVSVPSNVAEGHGRHSDREFRFLSIAHGSLMEVETQLLFASRLGCLGDHHKTKILVLAAETGRLLHGLLRSLATPAC